MCPLNTQNGLGATKSEKLVLLEVERLDKFSSIPEKSELNLFDGSPSDEVLAFP